MNFRTVGRSCAISDYLLEPVVARRVAAATGIHRRLGEGFGSTRIVERHRLRPDSAWPMLLTPLGVLWETWRSSGWGETLAWVG